MCELESVLLLAAGEKKCGLVILQVKISNNFFITILGFKVQQKYFNNNFILGKYFLTSLPPLSNFHEQTLHTVISGKSLQIDIQGRNYRSIRIINDALRLEVKTRLTPQS